MPCQHCGFKLRHDDKYCPNCGARVEKPGAQISAAAPQAAPSAQEAPAAPVSGEASGPRQANPEIHKAREEFFREFVATLPAPEEKPPFREKPGQLLLALTIVLCTAAEVLIIGDLIISIVGIGPAQWRFAPVYSVSALICVVLIELALILSVSVIRHKKAAARVYQEFNRVPALPPARPPMDAEGVRPVSAEQARPAPQASEGPSPRQSETPGVSGQVRPEPPRTDAPSGTGTAAPPRETGSQKGSVQLKDRSDGPTGCKMTFTLRGEQKAVFFGRFPAVIGRDIIPDGTVSQVHCALEMEGAVMIIRDLESANGVYVNGVRIGAPTVIEKNDRVIIGRATVYFEPV